VPGAFRAGEPCLLVDGKGRHYLIVLESGKAFHFHAGYLPHDQIIGSPEGTTLASSSGARLVAFRPRLADYILRMRRGAQVVYPKDIGPIVIWADIGPGMTVVEAGTGSGALTLALVRAVGREGRVVSVERREDHAAHARERIEGFLGSLPPSLELRIGDVAEVVPEVRPDRLVLDLPEPWEVVPAAREGLQPGGVFCCYLPTVPQLETTVKALAEARCFLEPSIFEVLHRDWTVSGRSVRPSHRMVGHTGFVMVTRQTSTP
jgi:tRNA (adenine57-N1/adenine58-N1)-methyltransferase